MDVFNIDDEPYTGLNPVVMRTRERKQRKYVTLVDTNVGSKPAIIS